MRWRPLLPGATLRDRLLACVGALGAVAATALVGQAASLPLPAIVAPMGASAVLVFAVPASPLAQPWSVVGGNTVSALVGIAAALAFGHGALACGAAVAGAVLAMSLARCLHPPGGAAALTAVIGGPAVAALGWRFALLPVALNSATLVLAGVGFHRLSGHRYPHRAVPAAPPPGIAREDLDAALAETGETFDIDPDDLWQLFAVAEAAARRRRR